MEQRKLSLTQSWIRFARILIQLKRAWEEHMEIWAETPRTEIEKLPIEIQRFVARNFNRSKFDVMLPRLVNYWRTLGGIEALEVKLPKNKKIRKEK